MLVTNGDSMKYIFITLKIIFLISILTSIIPTQGKSIDLNLVSRWEIQEWNDDAAVFWWDPPVTTSYFIASSGSYINYSMDYYDSTNFTHPSAGTIEIGNLTIHTTNNKTGEVLALSIYGWFPKRQLEENGRWGTSQQMNSNIIIQDFIVVLSISVIAKIRVLEIRIQL
jgi:hypothetical protein